MKKYFVESSNIEAIAYDIGSKILVVTFKGGSSYSYKEIHPDTICKLLFSESVGKSFHKNIKRVYKGEKVEPDQEAKDEQSN